MKNYSRCVVIIMIVVFITLSFSGCEPKTEDVLVEYWLSADGGKNYYMQGPIEYSGYGTSVYLKLKVMVKTNKNSASFPGVSLIIPDIDDVDAYIIGGPTVNPRKVVSNVIYDFTTRAVKDNDRYTELFVEFIPYSDARVEMKVEFDDSIDSGYDRSFTIKFH